MTLFVTFTVVLSSFLGMKKVWIYVSLMGIPFVHRAQSLELVDTSTDAQLGIKGKFMMLQNGIQYHTLNGVDTMATDSKEQEEQTTAKPKARTTPVVDVADSSTVADDLLEVVTTATSDMKPKFAKFQHYHRSKASLSASETYLDDTTQENREKSLTELMYWRYKEAVITDGDKGTAVKIVTSRSSHTVANTLANQLETMGIINKIIE